MRKIDSDVAGGSSSSSSQKMVQSIASPDKDVQISRENTTIIGDYSSVTFPSYHAKWLVQAYGNATLTSTLVLIKEKLIEVNKRYVFIQLGGNQVRTVTKNSIFSVVLELVIEIRKVNEQSRIYFVGVLPRPVDNDEIKPYIVKFNRWLTMAVKQVDTLFERVKFIPAHLKFLSGDQPRSELFHMDDQITLNEAGAKLLRNTLFNFAGFVKNE